MGQERQRFAIVSWGFGQGGLYACEIHWDELVGMGEDCYGGGKIF